MDKVIGEDFRENNFKKSAMIIKNSELGGKRDVFYCPRCKENNICPRGSCESEHVGHLQKNGVFVPAKYLKKSQRLEASWFDLKDAN